MKISEVFYGWKAGTTEIDERGNTNIEINCDTINCLNEEIDLLIDTEKTKKRGYLKQLHFIAKSVEFVIRETGDRQYEVMTAYTDKPTIPIQVMENKDIKTALKHVKQILKII